MNPNLSPRIAVYALSLVAVQSAVLAQSHTPPSVRRGIASSWASGLSLRTEASATATDRATLLRAPGTATARPTPWAPIPNVTTANYSLGSASHPFTAPMFPGAPNIEIDAHSTGNGVIPRFSETTPGLPDVAGDGGRWLAVTVSIRGDSSGLVGSHFRTVHGAQGAAGSELVSHYYGSSQGISPRLVGKTVVESRAAELGLFAGPTDDLDALDYGLGMITHNVRSNASIFFLEREKFFFSVTSAWAVLPEADQFFSTTPSGPKQQARPDDIYVVTWDTQSQTWSAPLLFKSGAELGFSGGSADLDGLDVDESNATLVFSGTRESGLPSQLMMHQEQDLNQALHPTAGGTEPLLASQAAGDTTSDRLGVGDNGSNDADAICTIDPESDVFDMVVGIPTAHWSAFPEPMGLSVARGQSVPWNYDPTVFFELNGWGNLGAMDANATLFVQNTTITATAPYPTSGWLPVQTQPRAAGQETLTFMLSGLTDPIGGAAAQPDVAAVVLLWTWMGTPAGPVVPTVVGASSVSMFKL